MTAEGKVSAVLLSYKRQQNLKPILQALLRNDVVSEIIVWNNDPEASLKGGGAVTVINSSVNFGPCARFAAAMLAANETIMFHDDDLLIPPEEIAGLYEDHRRNPNRICGIVGRNLDADASYNGTFVWGEVDIALGQFMLFSKALLASVYGDILRLAPMDHADDIAFSLLTKRKHFCRAPGKIAFQAEGDAALWKRPGHFEKRQKMIDTILGIKRG